MPLGGAPRRRRARRPRPPRPPRSRSRPSLRGSRSVRISAGREPTGAESGAESRATGSAFGKGGFGWEVSVLLGEGDRQLGRRASFGYSPFGRFLQLEDLFLDTGDYLVV